MTERFVLAALEPVDSDVDLDDPVQRRELRRHHGLIVSVIAGGSLLGSAARFLLGQFWPVNPDEFPWPTVVINAVGSLLIGAVMVVVTARSAERGYLRPFLATGVLGGFTTISACAVGVVDLLRSGRIGEASGYAAGALLAALAATGVGLIVTERIIGTLSRRHRPHTQA